MGSTEYALKMYERQQDIADNAAAFYAPMREMFIANRAEAAMTSPRGVLALINQICDSSDDVRLGVAVCDALKQSGYCWDGVSAIDKLLRAVATRNAEQEWEATPRDFAGDLAADRADFDRAAE